MYAAGFSVSETASRAEKMQAAVQFAGRVIASPKSGICLYQLTRWVEVQDFGATFRKQNEVSIVQLPRSWIEYCAVYGKNRCAQKK